MSPDSAPLISPQMTRLLADIERFCGLTGMSERALGESAMNDKNVVRDIRDRHRQLRIETEHKIRSCMADILAGRWAA